MILKKLYFIIVFSAIILSSCREDIISPGNPIGNINEPVRLQSNTSYSFVINASSISTIVKDFSGLNTEHSEIYISITDYQKGAVDLNIYDYSSTLIYQKSMSGNINGTTDYLDNVSPDIIRIFFSNFTGKLKIEIDSK